VVATPPAGAGVGLDGVVGVDGTVGCADAGWSNRVRGGSERFSWANAAWAADSTISSPSDATSRAAGVARGVGVARASVLIARLSFLSFPQPWGDVPPVLASGVRAGHEAPSVALQLLNCRDSNRTLSISPLNS
jgi:hypothetical protein